MAAGGDSAVHASQQKYIDTESKYGAHNYHPLPVVSEKGEGVYMIDTDGNKYFDFLSAYSAVNQGHGHPKIVQALVEQSQKLSLTSRAFHNNVYGEYCKFMHEFFGYQKVLPMNTGVEAVETAVKCMRKWGYEVKKVPKNEAKIIFCHNNFWGRTITACSSSSDPDCYENYGPYTPGLLMIEYNNVDALQKTLESDPNIVGMIVEPIQGEAGIIVPEVTYLQEARKLCDKHRVLLCCDEVQTGLCRTGKMLCTEHSGIRPDMVCLGKALSGGVYPVSALLADDEVMLTIKPGQHGSTYGGNPVGCAVAMAALNVLKDEKLAENAEKMGELFRSECSKMTHKWIKDIRGKGLLNAIEVDPSFASQVTAWQICVEMAKNGVLAKPTHDNIIRFAPPLVINQEQLLEAVDVIKKTFASFDK